MGKKVIPIIAFFLVLILTSIIYVPSDNKVDNSNQNNSISQTGTDANSSNGNIGNEQEENAEYQEIILTLYDKNGQLLLSLAELANKYGLIWNYNDIEGTIEIKDDYNTYFLLKNTTVIAKNGIFIPNLTKPHIDSDKKIFLPLNFLDNALQIPYKVNGKNNSITVILKETKDTKDTEVNSQTVFEQGFLNWDAEDLIEYLSFLSTPLTGAHISTQNSHLPGSDRIYRNGVHEGIDWYSGKSGIIVDRSTPVISMADGVIVRVDLDYQELSFDERQTLLETSKNIDHTPEYILDKLRGRSIWIQYDKGVLVRYAHLAKIEEGIKVGKLIKKGEVIGYTGNSGTSDGVLDNDQGIHLHSDILIYNHLFWEHLDQEQIRLVLEKIFPPPNK